MRSNATSNRCLAERLRRIRTRLADRRLTAALFYANETRPEFVRYVCPAPLAAPYAFALLTRDDMRLFVEAPWHDSILPTQAEVATAVGRAMDEHGPRVGLVNGSLVEVGLLEQMQAVAPHIELVDLTSDIVELRLVKDEDELAAHRRAGELADLGYQAFMRAARPGVKQYELVAEVEAALLELGAEDNFMLIGSGGRDVRAMTPPSSRALAFGDNVITELTPRVDGYYTQICRTLVVGPPSDDQCRSFDVFKRAADAALAIIRPGVTAADVARAENDVFRAEGLGEYCGAAYTRVRGHGLGLHFDETPAVLEDAPLALREGMVFIPHPNTYNPWAGYMVFGDTVVVTAAGCELLTRTPRELLHV
jgi:Xaa-Pro aminopeptidase